MRSLEASKSPPLQNLRPVGDGSLVYMTNY
jgi:hypothetical protein